MAHGQQDPIYSQYLTSPLIMNPAYAGINNVLNVSLSYRNQWAGFEGSPTTTNLNAHSSVADNKVGLGFTILQDRIGPYKNTEVHLSGAYKLDLDPMTLSFGMQFGLVNAQIDYSKLIYDPDPLFGQNESILTPNIGAGAILKSDQFLIGFSVPRILKTTIADNDQTYQPYNSHFYAFGSYVHYIGSRIGLKPSVLVRGVKGAPLSTDLNFSINLDRKYTAGIYTRNFNAYGLLLQALVLNTYRVGYTFEVPSNNSVGTTFTSHEITLGIKTSLFRFHDSLAYSEF
jgi:type IX secretion system PorP/SprF family membrane protein